VDPEFTQNSFTSSLIENKFADIRTFLSQILKRAKMQRSFKNAF